jgi:excisionase family DNA binding protein
MPDNIIRLSVSEAAKLFGVSALTVRRAIASGLLNYVVVQNRYKISFESLVKWSQSSAHVRNKSEAKGIGQFVGSWKITNKKFSPNPAAIKAGSKDKKHPSPYPPLHLGEDDGSPPPHLGEGARMGG